MKPENNIIYSYTDQDATDDGLLVALSETDRMTRTVFDELVNSGEFTDDTALLRGVGLLNEFGTEARRVYDQNIGGGIFTLTLAGETAWIMPNENGGLTIMRPEDY